MYIENIYKYFNSKQDLKSSIKTLLGTNWNILTVKTDIANNLNNCFHSVFVEEDYDPMQFFGSRTDSICDPETENLVSLKNIIEKLKNLNPDKSCGPDNIHNKVLIGVADAFAVQISLIFQKSYGSVEIPQVWKRANVSPLFKSGSRI